MYQASLPLKKHLEMKTTENEELRIRFSHIALKKRKKVQRVNENYLYRKVKRTNKMCIYIETTLSYADTVTMVIWKLPE